MKVLTLLGHAKWAAAFVAVVGFGMLSFNPFAGGTPYTLTAPFTNTSGLYPGSQVLIAGAQVGTVQGITLKGQTAMVTFEVDQAHAPVFSNATLDLRPKSLLGEMYIDLNPGNSGRALPSGSTLSPSQVTRAVDLEQLINTFNAPTRAKLQTLVLELGGGLAGQGPNTNETFTYGTADMNDLAAISQTLQNRDQQIQEVIQALNAVMAELGRSDRRSQLGELIVNTDAMMRTLANEDGQLQAALVATNSALARTNAGLSGTAGNLYDIFHTLPTLVSNTQALTSDLGGNQGLSALLYTCPQYCQEWASQAHGHTLFTQLLAGIDEGPVVFGGRDAQGYATRIAVMVDHCSTSGSSPCNGSASGPPTLNCKKLPPADQPLCEKIGQLPIQTTSGQLYMPANGADAVMTGSSVNAPSDTTLEQLLVGSAS